ERARARDRIEHRMDALQSVAEVLTEARYMSSQNRGVEVEHQQQKLRIASVRAQSRLVERFDAVADFEYEPRAESNVAFRALIDQVLIEVENELGNLD